MLTLLDQRKFLNDLIVVRHSELARIVSVLTERSRKLDAVGRRAKVATILLGAFIASQGAFVKLFGDTSLFTLLVFALAGIAIATIAGIETAFKFEARASELRILAAKCQSARFRHNSEWAHRIAIAEPAEAITAARELLAIQDEALSDAQAEAAKLGVDIVLKNNDHTSSGALEGWSRLVGDPIPDHDLPIRSESDLPPPSTEDAAGHTQQRIRSR